ncbi:hypothetical protein GCM10010383_08520 [Streptomyces lomondensis]|uniref:Uncharacterized protein n=1 Tax=Streptomyces lomondensis TaxID=68229 RepID=A0ABQ2WY56_9ACTN|nr:hypothetical protein GCM10010383_08520 [Streptomyces lomondensis]
MPHGPRGDADDRGEFSDPHATSEDVDVAAGSSELDRGKVRALTDGKPLSLPEPFSFDLDTADFL